MNWPEKICLLRKKTGLSREKFAVLAGVTASTITRWEKGIGKMSPLARERIDKLFDGAKLVDDDTDDCDKEWDLDDHTEHVKNILKYGN